MQKLNINWSIKMGDSKRDNLRQGINQRNKKPLTDAK
jgi:hypothetical protein